MFGRKLKSAQEKIKQLNNQVFEQEVIISELKRDRSFTNQEVHLILMAAGDYLDHNISWVRDNKKEYEALLSNLGSLVKEYAIFSKNRHLSFGEYLKMSHIILNGVPEQYQSHVRELSLCDIFYLADHLEGCMDANEPVKEAFESFSAIRDVKKSVST